MSQERIRRWLAGAVCAIMVASMLLPNIGVGSDTGEDLITPLDASYLANLNVRDVVWNDLSTLAVAVGNDPLGSGDTVFWMDHDTENWDVIRDGNPDVYYNGVSYMPSLDRYIIAGVESGSPNLIYWDQGFSWQNVPFGPTGSFAYTDVACWNDDYFVAVTDTGHAFFFNMGGSWSEITGALPNPYAYFKSTFWDSTNDIMWMLGYNTSTGGALAYRSHISDLMAGAYVAYRDGPVGYEMAYIGGEWSSNDYGIIVGDERILRFDVGVANPKYASAKLYSGTPNKRYGSNMVWCDSIKQFVLFGGLDETVIYKSDTWLYNPYSGKWKQIAPPTPPTGRAYHAMAYDSTRRCVVLYGGYNGGYLGDTWELDVSSLANITIYGWKSKTGGTPPGALSQASMTYCSRAGYTGVYLYGGTGGGTSNRFFKWDGTTWVNKNQVNATPSTYATSISYDPVSQRIIMFGGVGQEGNTHVYDMGLPNRLDRVIPVASPTPRAYHRMTSWDRYSGQAAIYGGVYGGTYRNDSWYYNYAGNRWTQTTFVTPQPGVRDFAMAAYKPSGNIVLFSGTTSAALYTNGTYSIGRYTDATTTILLDDAAANPQDVDWYPDGHEAIIAGTNGKIWRYTHATSILAPVTNDVYPGANYYAVGCKAPASPGYTLIMGDPDSGLRLNDVSGSTPISLNVLAPHVSYLDITTSAGLTRTNQQVDVDSGADTTFYYLKTRVWHSSGVAQISQVDAYLWYDEGNTGGLADYPFQMGASFDVGAEGNLRAHFRFIPGLPDIWAQLYPPPGPGNETTLLSGSCYKVNEGDGRNMTYYFAFSPHQQVRAASGPFGAEGPATQYRYDGFAPFGVWNDGDQSTVSALNRPNTWDIKVVASSGPDVTAAYDEFGFFLFTYISSSGLPGNLAGSGPPNSNVFLAPPGNVIFSANCPHQLLTYADSNMVGESTGQIITANNMQVEGGDYASRYLSGTGSGNAEYIFGSLGVYVPPSDTGRTSSTATGLVGEMRWWCWVPSVPEDRYTTTITYLLTHP